MSSLKQCAWEIGMYRSAALVTRSEHICTWPLLLCLRWIMLYWSSQRHQLWKDPRQMHWAVSWSVADVLIRLLEPPIKTNSRAQRHLLNPKASETYSEVQIYFMTFSIRRGSLESTLYIYIINYHLWASCAVVWI